MKRIIIVFLTLIGLLFTSCNNERIVYYKWSTEKWEIVVGGIAE